MNGQGFITVTGGSTPYTYDWDNDGTGDNDDNEDVAGLGDGTYYVMVTDSNGCTANDSIMITEPTSLTVAVDSTMDPSGCGVADGAIYITPMGGTPGYLFSAKMYENSILS